MNYDRAKKLALIFLLSYLLIGMSNEYIGEEVFNSGAEWYPVFSWDLFSSVPNEKTDYHMRIVRLGPTNYDPPLPFRETSALFDSIGASPTEYTPLINKLGRAAEESDQTQIDFYSAKVRAIFGDRPYAYEILKVRYDPVEYWRASSYLETELIFEEESNAT